MYVLKVTGACHWWTEGLCIRRRCGSVRDPASRAIFDLDITCVLCEAGAIVTEPRGRAMAKLTSSRYPCNICLGGGGGGGRCALEVRRAVEV